MCNGKKDDADKAGLFLPETNSHPASNIPRSAFCPLNGASIGPSLATLPFSAAAAFLYVVCSISYFHLSCKIRLLHIGSKKKKVVHFCTTFKTNLQIIKKWVGPYRTHPWSECNYRTWKSPVISMVCRQQARCFIQSNHIIGNILRLFAFFQGIKLCPDLLIHICGHSRDPF